MLPESLQADLKATKTAYYLYVFYIISFFGHLPARIPVLGVLHIDFVVIAIIFMLTFTAKVQKNPDYKIAYYIRMIFIYSVVVMPFVTWPGTIIHNGLPSLIKATIFFYFTYKLVLDENRLKIIVYAFVAVNTFRVIEPLFLHLTTGYWGDKTTYGEDQVDRLSGAPHDIVNPNGLAFIIATVLPFYHYLFGTQNLLRKMIYWGLLPPLLLTMALTLSRSGIMAIVFIYGVVFLRSKKKVLLSTLAIFAAVGFLASLNEVQRDRYLSVFSHNTKSSATADGRVTGLITYLGVAMQKPIFGHGLGTSLEANFNYSGRAQPAHNLWLEVLQELGIVGFFIFCFYVVAVYKGFKYAGEVIKRNPNSSAFLISCLSAMQVWFAMNFLFSFASYGLTSYEWYLFGGFSAVIANIALRNEATPAVEPSVKA